MKKGTTVQFLSARGIWLTGTVAKCKSGMVRIVTGRGVWVRRASNKVRQPLATVTMAW